MPQITVRTVFEDCQHGMHGHAKLTKTLVKIYNASSLDTFWEDFIKHLRYSMVVFTREPAVERTIEFVCKFAASLITHDENKNQDGENEDEETEEEMPPFLAKFFDFLLQHHGACDKAVRFRCCQLINKLLNSMGDNAQIDDDLYDRIYEGMLQRLKDKFPVVRQQAVSALSRLQDPTDKDCPVINAYLFMLGCDPNADVRRAVLNCIAASTKTLEPILERTRDAKDTVRALAYLVLSEKVHIKALTIAQRVRVLQEGLNDRTAAVKDACASRLLQAWLRSFEGNIIDLLKCLDVENSLETCQQLLEVLFKKSPLNEVVSNFDLLDERLVVPLEQLDCESALYWRCLCEYVRGLDAEGEEYLEKILPTVSKYCEYVQSVAGVMKGEDNMEQQLQNEFILQQLITLAGVLDLSDEVGRRNMKRLLRELLLSDAVTESLVTPLIQLYVTIVRENERQVTELVEAISEIKEPMTTVETGLSQAEQRALDLKLAGVRVELNQLREELDECIKAQNFERAAEIKVKVAELDATKNALLDDAEPKSQEVRTEKNDPQTLLKCLTIAVEMLKGLSTKGLSPTLHTLLDTLILPSVQSVDPAVRNAALQALGLCCLLCTDKAKEYLVLFLQVAHMDQEGIQVTALKIIFDLLIIFGLDTFEIDATDNLNESQDATMTTSMMTNESRVEKDNDEAESQDNTTVSSVIKILTSMLDHESSEIRTVCAEGLAKLLLAWRLVSPKLFSRLVLLWYNPTTEGDTRLRHCLGTFFPLYAFASKSHQEVVEQAFMPTMKTLARAPSTSPLAEVSEVNVAEFLVQLTNIRHLLEAHRQENTGPLEMPEMCSHDNVALSVCNYILSEPHSFSVRTMCRVLNLLELSPNNESAIKDLCVLAEQMTQEVKDKQCVKMLQKFHGTVTQLAKDLAERRSPTPVHNRSLAPVAEESEPPAESSVPETPKVDKSVVESASAKSVVLESVASTSVPMEQEPSDEEPELSVFASPTPVRRSGRAKKPAKTVVDKMRKNLAEEIMSESQVSEAETPPRKTTRGRTTRSSRKAAQRQPLSDMNEDA